MPTLDSLHRPSKTEFITVSCRPPNAFQPSAYNSCILAWVLLDIYWRVCKCCVTYLLTYLLGNEKFVFVLQKFIKTLLQQCRIQSSPDSRFRGEECLFSFSENVLKLSNSNAEFKNFPKDNTPDPRFRGNLGKESLFSLSENVYQNSSTAMQNIKKIPGVKPPDPRFWEGEVKVASS